MARSAVAATLLREACAVGVGHFGMGGSGAAVGGIVRQSLFLARPLFKIFTIGHGTSPNSRDENGAPSDFIRQNVASHSHRLLDFGQPIGLFPAGHTQCFARVTSAWPGGAIASPGLKPPPKSA